MNDFITTIFTIMRNILMWANATARFIRYTPFLLFIFGFIILGLVVAVFGRMLRDG